MPSLPVSIPTLGESLAQVCVAQNCAKCASQVGAEPGAHPTSGAVCGGADQVVREGQSLAHIFYYMRRAQIPPFFDVTLGFMGCADLSGQDCTYFLHILKLATHVNT